MTGQHPLDCFFYPRGIAVIGASQGKSAFANHALNNLRNYGFRGRITAVNPRYEEIDGVPCRATLADIEERPDLCVIAVRAELVPGLLREAIALGVPAATIVSSGFGERDDPASQALQRELDAIRASGNIRLVGPNAMGLAAFDCGAVAIASANVPADLPSGSLAIVSQSGSTGVSMAVNAGWQGVGLSKLITLGNETDLGVAEVLRYLADDPVTSVVLVYIEAIRSFSALREAFAACLAKGKVIIVLKGGMTAAGGKAAASHTGALAGSGAVWRGVAAQLGIISAKSIEHAVQLAQLFTCFGAATGARFGAASAGGGLGVLLTDMLVEHGIDAPPFAPQTVIEVEQGLPDVTAHNPLDMGATFLSGDGNGLSQAMLAIDADPAIDNIIVAIVPMLDSRAAAYTSAVLRGLADVNKPVIVLSCDPRLDSPAHSIFREAGFPVLWPTELAVSSLKSWADYRPHEGYQSTKGDGQLTPEQAAVVHEAAELTKAGRSNVLEDKGKTWLRAWDVPCAPEAIATDEDDSVAIARRLGFPVVLKVLSDHLLHRGVGNGVLLSLGDENAVRNAYRDLKRLAAGLSDARVLVQRMASSGHEFLVGAVRDPVVGLTLVLNKGGDDAERQGDALFELLPIDRERLRETLESWAPVRTIERHNDNVDIDSLADVVVKIGNFLTCLEGQVQELDINPVIVGRHGQGATIVDALIVLRAADGAQAGEHSAECHH